MNVVLIEYFPMWMAPNGILFFSLSLGVVVLVLRCKSCALCLPPVITLLGLLCGLVAHVVAFFYAPTLVEPLPAWAYALTAFGLFVRNNTYLALGFVIHRRSS